MDAERKMVCTHADNTTGGDLSCAVLSCDFDGLPQQVTAFNWVLERGQAFEFGAIYGVAIWKIADAPDPKNA